MSCLQETEKLEAEKSDLENEIQNLQQQKDQLEFLLQAHVPLCKVDPQSGSFKIKAEPSDGSLNSATTITPSSSCHLPSSSSSRPNSLPLERQRNGEVAVAMGSSCGPTGVPLSTPSSGLFTYTGLDGLVEGSTGLTPLASGPGVSCASQLHRSESESGSETVSSPTLISL